MTALDAKMQHFQDHLHHNAIERSRSTTDRIVQRVESINEMPQLHLAVLVGFLAAILCTLHGSSSESVSFVWNALVIFSNTFRCQ